MNDIQLLPGESLSYGFIPPEFLAPGESEYRIRDAQLLSLGKDPASFRHLTREEVETLERNANSCRKWEDVLVADPFDPDLVKRSVFAGLVRLGRLERCLLASLVRGTAPGQTRWGSAIRPRTCRWPPCEHSDSRSRQL